MQSNQLTLLPYKQEELNLRQQSFNSIFQDKNSKFQQDSITQLEAQNRLQEFEAKLLP